ncbi:MAG: hypothetical protein WBE72_14565 [Terracidiphilus sp.]
MREVRFLCLAVSRRDGGSCIAGIDLDSGKWIRPVDAKTHGAFGDHELVIRDPETRNLKMLAPLDVLELRVEKFVGNPVQPENWEMAPAACEDRFVVLRRFDGSQDGKMLISSLDRKRPLLHSYSNRIPADDPLLKRTLSHSLSIIRPEQLHWKVAPHPTYRNKLRVEADFRFDGDPYCLVVTDPIWEARCRPLGPGRYPHSSIAEGDAGRVLLTVSLAEAPLQGYHYKLAAAVVNLPS